MEVNDLSIRITKLLLSEYSNVVPKAFKSTHEVYTTKTILAGFILEDTQSK